MSVAVIAMICPQISLAEGFTGADFLAWPQDQQNSYIQVSIAMAGVVATQTKPETAACIDTWYAPDTDLKEERNAAIRDTIGKYASYHPSGVIFAVLQDACGAFK